MTKTLKNTKDRLGLSGFIYEFAEDEIFRACQRAVKENMLVVYGARGALWVVNRDDSLRLGKAGFKVSASPIKGQL